MYRSFLLVDNEFRILNIPLSPEKRRMLDDQIRKYKQTIPIPVWNGYVLTQYDLFEIKTFRPVSMRSHGFAGSSCCGATW